MWKLKSMIDAEEDLFQWSITPLRLLKRYQDGSASSLWEDYTPNLCRTLHPLFPVREKKMDEDLFNVVVPNIDRSCAELKAEDLCAQVGNKAHDTKIRIYDTMKDLKFFECILCRQT